jgi:ankyrin repeat protein
LLNKYNRPNETPLIIACLRNNEKFVKLLLDYYRYVGFVCELFLLIYRNDHNGIININQVAQDGEHLLHVICRVHNISDEILTMILQFPGINVNCKNDGDTTPLHYYVQHNHSLNCQIVMYVRMKRKRNLYFSSFSYQYRNYFFEGGADPNAKNNQAETCLHKAIFNNKVRVMMVKPLLEHHARADARGGKEGDTPLHYAIRMGRRDLVHLLLSNGGDVTVKNDHDKDSIELSIEVLQTAGMKVTEQKSAEDIADLIRNVKEYVNFDSLK